MSDTAPEAAEPDGGFDGGFGAEVVVWSGGELESEVIDAELMDDEPEGEPELIGNAEIEPWAVGDNPGDWGYGGQAKAPEQRQSDHDGARPGGGPNGGAGGGFTGKMTRRERRRRQRAAGGGGGSGVHVSLIGGVLTNASVLKTGAVASGNSAGLINGPAKGTGRRGVRRATSGRRK